MSSDPNLIWQEYVYIPNHPDYIYTYGPKLVLIPIATVGVTVFFTLMMIRSIDFGGGVGGTGM